MLPIGGGKSIAAASLRGSGAALPEADDFVLGAVGHVDELLVEDALADGAVGELEYEAVLAHLEEEEVAADVGAAVHGERLPVHLARRQRLQVDVVGGLQ